jgi:soluble cytochrome b562
MNTKQDTIEPIVERTAQQVIADEFLIARAKILELAATLDRIERSSGDVEDSKQMNLLAQGMHILCDEEVDKAKRVQLLMSRQYDPHWQSTMSIARKGV